jgi:periplasmic protein TonB
MSIWQRFTALATVVVALHAAGLWALNGYKLPTSLDKPVPVLQTRAIEPPQLPQLQQAPPPVPTTPTPALPNPKAVAAANKAAQLKPAAEPAPAATAPLLAGKLPSETPTAAQTPTGSYAPAPSAATAAPSVASSTAPVAASAARSPTAVVASGAGVSGSEAAVQLPGVDVDHVDTQYRIPRPAISMRLGESGRVMVAIQVGLSGKPLQVQVVKSSGFDRLDDNAVKTVMRWRFRPGTRNGVPEVMWVTQPVDYPVINQE